MTVAERAVRALPEGGAKGVWDAPGRVNVIGEHTDYNDGFVLPFALPLRTAIAARPLDGPLWSVRSDQTSETVQFGVEDLAPGRVTGWAAYVAGVVWALHDAGHAVTGAELSIASDVPLGAGLSSSAALEAAVLTALLELSGIELPDSVGATLAQRAENVYVGMPCGIMDQTASLRCVSGHALLLDCRTLAVEQVPLELESAGLAILVIDTKAPHRHVTGEYAARRRACEEASAALGVAALRDVDVVDLDSALAALPDLARPFVRHVVTENRRVLDTVAALRAGQMETVGTLLTASHASMRDDFAITVPEVDTAVEVALASGAYGARMTGGGFGGCVLALVDAEKAGRVADAVTTAFAERGFAAPSSFVAQPAGGAGRVTMPGIA